MANTKKLLPRITGLAYAVPSNVRLNDDPVFDWIKANHPPGDIEKMFAGYETRHVLEPAEDLMSIMVPASRKAMNMAGIKPADVEMLLGIASVSAYQTPNELSLLHKQLQLPQNVWCLPIGNDYSNFNASLLLADALMRAGRVRNTLICVGGNWTRNVSYQTPESVSAADGAGAAVLEMSDDDQQWYVLDQHTITDTSYYGSMYTGSDAIGGNSNLLTPPYYHITPNGFAGFSAFGAQIPIQAANELLAKNNLKGSDVALIPTTTSSVLIDAWIDAIQPAQTICAITEFGNTTVAGNVMNFAWSLENDPITTEFAVILGIGPDMHSNAILLARG